MFDVKHVPIAVLAAAMVAAGCAALEAQEPPRPTRTVEAIGKVVDTLAADAIKRLGTEPYRGLPVVVRTATPAGGMEAIVAELLRTRLLERGAQLDAACAARCMEIVLQEFATDAPVVSGITPGEVLTVATGSVPLLGNLTRSLNERERDRVRSSSRTSGLFITYTAREGNRYTVRGHQIAVVSTHDGNVALEHK